jgi:hypothetical protein
MDRPPHPDHLVFLDLDAIVDAIVDSIVVNARAIHR